MRVDPLVATFVAVSALAVIDGDTFHIGAERYRLLGIDAAEIHRAQCDAERRLGELTKRRLETLAGSGQVDLAPIGPGSATATVACSCASSSMARTPPAFSSGKAMPAPGAAAARIGASTSIRPRAWRGLFAPPRRQPLRIEPPPAPPRPTTGPPASL
jgi:hypothetical protein